MSAPLRVGFIMSTEVGLRTQHLNWRACLESAAGREMGIEPAWITIEWWREGGLLERLPGVPNGLKARLRARLELREGLKQGPFDALFVAQERMLHGARGLLARQPYFITADVTAKQLDDFGDLYGKQASAVGFYERRKHAERRERYQNAAALFPWSHWAAASMVGDYGADPARVHVVPPGVDVAAWRCPERDYSGHTNILFVGGDFHRKGGDLLLDWARATPRRDWTLHLVTRDAVPTSDERVRVHSGLSPNDPALMRLYREAHVFALPTRGDCYSLAGIEAMAAGLPVLLSETGGTGDIVRDGETGYLLPPGDGAALAERLDHLLAHPDHAARMGRAARADAEARYDAEANIRRTVGILRAALGV